MENYLERTGSEEYDVCSSHLWRMAKTNADGYASTHLRPECRKHAEALGEYYRGLGYSTYITGRGLEIYRTTAAATAAMATK